MEKLRKEALKRGKGTVEVVNWGEGEFKRADEFDDVTTETFFEFVDAIVGMCGIGETLDAIKVIAFEIVLGGVFDHLPLDGVLGVVGHVLLVGAGEEIDDFVAIKEEHGGGEVGGLAGNVGFGKEKLNLVAEKLVHILIIGEVAIGEVATFGG